MIINEQELTIIPWELLMAAQKNAPRARKVQSRNLRPPGSLDFSGAVNLDCAVHKSA